METIVLIFLFILGTLFGSFSSVLIYRLYSNEKGIMLGRSHCTKCNKTLGVLDLIPIFSYLFSFGKCRHCKEGYSSMYPILEIIMGFCFFLVGLYLIDLRTILEGNVFEAYKLLYFLLIVFLLVMVSFYDIKYQLVPVDAIGIGIIGIIILHIIGIYNNDYLFFFDHYESNFNGGYSLLINGLIGSFIIYSFFYIQIFGPGIYYALEKKRYKIIWTEFYEFFIIPFWMIVSVFVPKKEEKEDEEEEIYTFMGHGDLWIGVFMGLVGGLNKAILGLILAYLIGSIVGVYIIASGNQKNSRIAFGPFLALGIFISLLYYEQIIKYIFTILQIS